MGLCDMHCHLLPLIDDGYVKTDTFERMLTLYRESGFDAIAFTPHIYNPYVTTNIASLRQTFTWAKPIAENLGLSVYLGSELYVGEQADLKCIPIANRYALVEFGLSLPPSNLIPRLKALSEQGLKLIVAHVERYRWLEPTHALFARMAELGCLFQANVEAVENGSTLPYLKAGKIDLFATDNHGDETLPTRLVNCLNDWPLVYERMQSIEL